MDSLLIYNTGNHSCDIMDRVLKSFSKNGYYLYGLFEKQPEDKNVINEIYDDYTVVTGFNIDGSLAKYRESGCRMVLVNDNVSFKYFNKILENFNIVSLVTDYRYFSRKNFFKKGIFYIPYRLYNFLKNIVTSNNKTIIAGSVKSFNILKESDLILSSSSFITKKLINRKINKENIELLPLFSLNSQPYKRPEKKERITLYIPAVFDNNNIIKLMMNFVANNKNRYHLIIDDRSDTSVDLRNYLTCIGSTESISFYDNIKSRDDYMVYTDFVVVPDKIGNRYIPFVIDALSFGRGLITCNAPLITEIAPEKECSFVIKGNFNEIFHIIMNTVYNDKSLIEKMGTNCYNRFTDRYTETKFIEKLRSVINTFNT